MRLARALGAATLAALLLAGASGCGGDGGDGGGAGPEEVEIGILDPSLDPDAGVAPEDVRLGPSEAAAALRVIKDLASSAAAALGPNDLELIREDAKPLQADIAPSWATVALTVKDRDPATHAALKEAFPSLATAVDAGDEAGADAASARIAAAVDAYVEKFPAEDLGQPGPELTPTEGPREPSGEATAPPGEGSMPDFADPPAPAAQPPADSPEPWARAP